MGFSYPISGAVVRSGAERATLVRRTYALVFASILVTMAGTWLALSNESLMLAAAKHPIITFLCSMLPLWMAMRSRNSNAQSLSFVFLFNVVMGVSISPIIYVYGRTAPGLIGQAALLTLGAFGALTTYAWVSRRDFSAWRSFFTVGLVVLILVSLLNMFFQNPGVSLWLAGATVLVFSGLLVYDTWRLRNLYAPDQYVAAAVNIYLDLLNMFLAILQLLGGGRSRE
ncbi:MAG: Bax inhibitor-1/YccA family protein [Gemmatimonadaceae bacterium]|nr:Bax inhibitor-1/YccA family protein [Gemmatimonadaceae bacterium]